jgi:hypothetical protein
VRPELHGITSLGLLLLSVALAWAAAFLTWWVRGILYLAICAVCLAAILCAFCAKRPCQVRYGRIVPGKLAALVSREPGRSTKLESTVFCGGAASGIGIA